MENEPMKLPEALVEKAASTQESRYTLQAVKADVEGKRIIATDSHVLAIVPCEFADGDQSTLIPLAVVKELRAMQRAQKKIPLEVAINSTIKTTGIDGATREFKALEGQFPNVDAVRPKGEAYEGAATICLDYRLLANLAEALGATKDSPVIKLWIRDKQSAIKVQVGANPEAEGVLMPLRDF